jgi:hypothetical protein
MEGVFRDCGRGKYLRIGRGSRHDSGMIPYQKVLLYAMSLDQEVMTFKRIP